MVASGPTAIGPSGTTMMPAVPEPASPPRWSGRAQVRPPEQNDLGAGWDDPPANWDQAGSEWDERERRQSGRLLAPILITLLVLVLLGILAFGVWLVLRSQSSSQNTGTVATPTDSGMTATAQSSTLPAATLPPTTATEPTPPVPASVGIPNVSGSDYGGAVATLQALGFQTRRTNRTSTTVPAGAVIGTDPPIGTELPASSTVTIIVSSGSPTTPPATPTPTRTVQPSATPNNAQLPGPHNYQLHTAP
jgi:cytoskeletal protein RodZ